MESKKVSAGVNRWATMTGLARKTKEKKMEYVDGMNSDLVSGMYSLLHGEPGDPIEPTDLVAFIMTLALLQKKARSAELIRLFNDNSMRTIGHRRYLAEHIVRLIYTLPEQQQAELVAELPQILHEGPGHFFADDIRALFADMPPDSGITLPDLHNIPNRGKNNVGNNTSLRGQKPKIVLRDE